ncbi:AhpC/TSA family protein [Sphingobacterium sp. JUb20]|nr:AhpC/TSA family protein [Sphingobacterium sp. JUb20]
MKITMIKGILCFYLMIVVAMVNGQEKALKVGDLYEYKELVKVLNAEKAEIDLKKYEDRLLILDFFTTSCGSCIAAMPKNNKLQKHFDSRIQILPVTVEKRERVKNFFSKNETVKDNKLPVGYADVALKETFPYQGVPHVVWIYKGIVKAITNADMLEAQYIDEMLAEKDVNSWPQKNDFYSFDPSSDESMKQYFVSSAIMPYINGAKLSYSSDTLSSGLIRDSWVNVPVVTAYVYAFSIINELPLMKKERIVLEVSDRSYFEKPDSVVQSIWEQLNSIGYESILPSYLSEVERMTRIVADLNNKLGLNARLENLEAQVWLVEKVKSTSKVDAGQKTGQPLALKMGLLEVMYPTIPPIVLKDVDEMRLLTIKGSDDFETLKQQLSENGLKLSKAVRPIQKLIITEL